MNPAEFAILATLLVASVAALSWTLIRRSRWASDGLGLELASPSERTDLLEVATGILFIGTVVTAGILGGRRVAALTFGVQIGLTAVVAIVLALGRPRTFGPRAIPGDRDEDIAVGHRERYDLFVSYKSEDVQMAREVADRLIASGITVWFAEYEILLADRDQFQLAILEGIRRSRYGLAITNNRYATSPYCTLEMEELLERLGPSQVIEARLPPERDPHRAFPGLGGSRQVEPASSEDILAFVQAETDWGIRPGVILDDAPARPVEGRTLGGGYVLDAAGWEIVETGGERLEGDTTKGPVFRLAHAEYRLVGNVFSGPESAPQARRQDRTPDDREMYEALLDYVPHHVGGLGADVRGVHLFFHGGLSQMAVTYRLAGYWTRKHSVILPHPETEDPTEFVFTFGFFGPFREYCRHAYLMDHLVMTLRWVV